MTRDWHATLQQRRLCTDGGLAGGLGGAEELLLLVAGLEATVSNLGGCIDELELDLQAKR